MTKKTRLIVIVAVVLIVAGVVAGLLWWLRPIISVSPQVKNIPQYTASSHQQLVDDVNKKYGNKDYTGAINLIEGQNNRGDVGLQLLLAGAYANSGNPKKGLEIYQTLDASGKLPGSELANFAEMAEQAGDTRAAIEAYKKAKQYAVSSKKISDDEIATYDYKIAQLEKKL